MNDFITMPKTVDVKGQPWSLYMAEFTGAEGTFEIHFYAVSMEHAAIVVEDIKGSLKLVGRFVGSVKP